MKKRTRVILKMSRYYLERLKQDPEIIALVEAEQVNFSDIIQSAVYQAATDYDGIKEYELQVEAEMMGQERPMSLHIMQAQGRA